MLLLYSIGIRFDIVKECKTRMNCCMFNILLPFQPNIKLVCSHMAQCTSYYFGIIIYYYIIT